MKQQRMDPAAAGAASNAVAAGQEEKVPSAWRKHYARLLQLRGKVIQEAVELSTDAAESTTGMSQHPAEAASDSYDRDLALSLLAFEHNALHEIDEALRRIRLGSYGVCELTGMPIPRRRLEAIPWARYTTEAQAQMERTAETPHAHLNERGSARAQNAGLK